jgi:hypothetical protein
LHFLDDRGRLVNHVQPAFEHTGRAGGDTLP